MNQAILKSGAKASPADRIPADEVETAVVNQIRGLLRSPEIIVGTWRAARQEIRGLAEAAVREALSRLDPIWDELFPTEQARIIRLLVARIDVDSTGLDVHLRVDGLSDLVSELSTVRDNRDAA